MTTPKFITYTRDIASVCLAIFGTVHQEITGHVNLDLLTVYTLLLGVPGASALIQLWKGKVEITVTPDTQSPSPPLPSPPPSSSV